MVFPAEVNNSIQYQHYFKRDHCMILMTKQGHSIAMTKCRQKARRLHNCRKKEGRKKEPSPKNLKQFPFLVSLLIHQWKLLAYFILSVFQINFTRQPCRTVHFLLMFNTKQNPKSSGNNTILNIHVCYRVRCMPLIYLLKS